MRRLALFATLMLSGCSGSGFWTYQTNTFTFPWQNPNGPVSDSANFERSRHGMKSGEPTQILTEAGDIWPGPPAPVPTLKQLQKQQLAEISSQGAGDATAGLAPLPTLPSIPGYEISTQDPMHAAPNTLFSHGAVNVPGGNHATTNYRGVPGTLPPNAVPQTQGNGNIVVPNGNGTSTVISPTGQVTTVPDGK